MSQRAARHDIIETWEQRKERRARERRNYELLVRTPPFRDYMIRRPHSPVDISLAVDRLNRVRMMNLSGISGRELSDKIDDIIWELQNPR